MEMNKEMMELGADMLDKVTGGAGAESMLAGDGGKRKILRDELIKEVGVAAHSSGDVLGAALRGGKDGLINGNDALSESVLDGNLPLH